MGDIEGKREYVVPITLLDERLVTVKASNRTEAMEKVRAGKYRSLGRSLGRGILTVGNPRRKQDG